MSAIGVAAADARGGTRWLPLALGAAAVAAAAVFAAAFVRTGGAPILAAPIIAALVALVVLGWPIAGLYMLFAAALLLEQFDISGLQPFTAGTHFFENLSTYSPIPLRLSLSDLLAVAIALSWGARRLVRTNEPLRVGPLAWPLAAYALAFGWAGVVGAARGGAWDPIIALAEARGALYMCLMAFLTANLVRNGAQIRFLLWEFALIVGVKALQGIANYAEMRDRSLTLEAVTSHEDVVFFDALIVLAITMFLVGVRGRFFYALLALLPLAIVAELLTQRRSGFAALAVTVVVVAIMAFFRHPRRTLAVVGVSLLLSTMYAGVFWNSTSRIAEPLRVVRGFVDPAAVSWRDRSSDLWRDIENSNIAFTVQQLPLTGVGLGQQYLFEREPPPLTTFVYWRYIAHNAVLWLWLKGGPVTAFAFWWLVGIAVITGMRLYRRLRDPYLRAIAAFPVLLVVAQVVFSSVDLGLTYNRTMTVLGVALGLLAPLAARARAERAAVAAIDP